MIFVIVLPFLGALDLPDPPARRHGRAHREERAGQRQEFDDYVKKVAADGDPASRSRRPRRLRDNGTIDQAEFDALKAKALA